MKQREIFNNILIKPSHHVALSKYIKFVLYHIDSPFKNQRFFPNISRSCDLAELVGTKLRFQYDDSYDLALTVRIHVSRDHYAWFVLLSSRTIRNLNKSKILNFRFEHRLAIIYIHLQRQKKILRIFDEEFDIYDLFQFRFIKRGQQYLDYVRTFVWSQKVSHLLKLVLKYVTTRYSNLYFSRSQNTPGALFYPLTIFHIHSFIHYPTSHFENTARCAGNTIRP